MVKPPFQLPIVVFKNGRYYDYQTTDFAKKPGDLLEELLSRTPEDLFLNRFKWAGNDREKFEARYDPQLGARFLAQGSLTEYLTNAGFMEGEIARLRDKTVGQLYEDSNALLRSAFPIEMRHITDLREAQYPKEQTTRQLFDEWGLSLDDAAKYLAFAFVPEHEEEVSFVYRSKDVGIAADCMSITGSTPPFAPEIFNPCFNLGFYEGHLANQMGHEYHLGSSEYMVTGMYALDDKDTIPHLTLRVATPVSVEEIARRIHGNDQAIKEHPILFSVRPDAVREVTSRFDMWPSAAFALNLIGQDKCA